MNKAIRLAVAMTATVALSFLWAAILPAGWSFLVSFTVGAVLGALAMRRGTLPAPGAYSVSVRDEDYEIERLVPMSEERRRWDEPMIRHLFGVPWRDAEVPPRYHECWPQTDGWIGFDHTQRCACGAIRAARFGGEWFKRNERRGTP